MVSAGGLLAILAAVTTLTGVAHARPITAAINALFAFMGARFVIAGIGSRME